MGLFDCLPGFGDKTVKAKSTKKVNLISVNSENDVFDLNGCLNCMCAFDYLINNYRV